MHPFKANVPNPDLGDVELGSVPGVAAFTAASNRVSNNAAALAAAGAPYTAIAAPSITRKQSGIFDVFGWITIAVNGGTLVDGDGILFSILANAVAFGAPTAVVAASTATGAPAGSTIACTFSFDALLPGNVALGAGVVFGVQVTTANGHTSGVIVGQGCINVFEMPA